MFRSWKIGTLFGIGIYVHATFLLLPLFVFFVNLVGGQLDMALYALAMIPAVFGCVVLHELGHALTARHYGIETRDITLYPIGGVARLERLPQRPWQEFWIALAGPAVNVVIALMLALLPGVLAGTIAFLKYPTEQANILVHLLIANIFLVGFNLLPAFPMDGGRVLRALLATQLGQLRATTIAANLGLAMAILFGVFGFVGQQPFLILIGVFVFLAGQQELAVLRYRQAHHRAEPLEVLPANEEEYSWPHHVSPGQPSVFTWDDRAGSWIEWRNGRPIHTISVK